MLHLQVCHPTLTWLFLYLHQHHNMPSNDFVWGIMQRRIKSALKALKTTFQHDSWSQRWRLFYYTTVFNNSDEQEGKMLTHDRLFIQKHTFLPLVRSVSLPLSFCVSLAVVWRSIESPWLAICSLTVGGVICVWERVLLCEGWGRAACLCVCLRVCVCMCVCSCVHACTGERAHGVWRKPWGSALATEPFLLLFKLDQRQ